MLQAGPSSLEDLPEELDQFILTKKNLIQLESRGKQCRRRMMLKKMNQLHHFLPNQNRRYQ